MEIKYLKNVVSVPFNFKSNEFNNKNIIKNKLLKEKPIDTYTNGKEWINNKAKYMFNSNDDNCFIKRYVVNNSCFKPLSIDDKECNIDESRKSRKLEPKKKIFFFGKYENIKFSIDKVQLWLMRSENGFVTFEISIVVDDKQVISDESCYNILKELRRPKNKIFSCQNVEKDKCEKFYFEFREYVKKLLDEIGFKKDVTFHKTKKLLLNYIVTDDIDNSEVDCFFNDILNYVNKNNNSEKKEISHKELYYKKEPFYYKWLATEDSITMIGDGKKNKKLTQQGGIVNNIFERHLCLMLYYENISMICDKAENISHKVDDKDMFIKSEYKEQYELIYEIMKSENDNNKEEFIRKIFETNPNDYKRFFYNEDENYIGGIANGDIGSCDEQLNLVYAFYYAIKKKDINKRIGEILENCNIIKENPINLGKKVIEVVKGVKNIAM